MRNGHRFIGLGIYTVLEAARLAEVPPRSVHRWVRGYTYTRHGRRYELPAVVGYSLDPVDGTIALSFRDLQELRALHAFRTHGVSWHALRLAHHAAQARVDDRHPFSSGRFVTDGRRVLTEVLGAASNGDLRELEDIVSRQLVFRRIMNAFLRGLEIVGGRVVRWYPLGSRRVVLDPARSFGQPIIEEGVPTLVLYKAFLAEESYGVVARWFEVDHRSVRAAVHFESQLATA